MQYYLGPSDAEKTLIFLSDYKGVYGQFQAAPRTKEVTLLETDLASAE